MNDRPGNRPPRLLLLLAQSPFDPASGAAVSMRQTACLLAHAGWQVRALSTSLSESHRAALPFPPPLPAGARADVLADVGAGPHDGARQVLQVVDEGVTWTILHATPAPGRHWEDDAGATYNRHYRALLAQFQPDVVLTFGGDASDVRRRALARQAGAKVVFALHNLAYLRPDLRPGLQQVDALLAPSQFLARQYRAAGQPPAAIAVLPPPIWPRDTQAATLQPVFYTFVNPERAKGAELVARLALQHPELPFLVVESRANAAHFSAIAGTAGLAQAPLDNVMVSPGMASAADIFAITRVLLMPSLVPEAAGRLAMEALANGIPALVSDAGALPELAARGAVVIPWSRDARGDSLCDEPARRRWSDAALPLAEDPAWNTASLAASAHWRGWTLAEQSAAYDAWFTAVATGQA